MRRALLLALLLLAPTSLAAFAGRDAALASLDASQGADGGWGTRAATDWVILGLAAAGEDPAAWGVETYLVTHPPEPTSLLAWERATVALACSGFDARRFHGVDYALVVELGYFGGQFGSPTQVNDDFWGILALRAAGVPANDTRIQSSAAFVLAAQRPDGGWGWSVTGASDPDDTGAALMALAASAHPLRGPALERALDRLRATQAPDGGWGFGATSNVLATAWVAMGLLAVGEDPTRWTTPTGGDPFASLAARQLPGGGFAYSASDATATPTATGTALTALSGRTYACAG